MGGIMPGNVADHLSWMRLRGLSEATVYGRLRALTRMSALIPVPLLEAETGHLMAWRVRLDMTDAAVGVYVGHARSFYDWCVTSGLRADNPATILPIPRLGRRLPRPISEADIMAALACAPPRIRPWLVLAGWCGLRAKEIALLRRSSILETAAPPVLIIAADATKGRTEHVVPLCAFAVAELGAARLPKHGYAFRRYDGRPGANSAAQVSHLCNEHLHDCDVAATLHQLRHRFASRAYGHGHDLRAVQEMLGHASVTSTAGYAAYDQPSAQAAVEAIPVPKRLRAVPLKGAI
jgi:integrase/recombinase XerC